MAPDITGADILGRLLRGISRIADQRVPPAIAQVVAEPGGLESDGVQPLVAHVAVDPELVATMQGEPAEADR